MPKAILEKGPKVCLKPECDRYLCAFESPEGLTRHINARHIRTVVYECSYCEYCTPQVENCRRHIRNCKSRKSQDPEAPICSPRRVMLPGILISPPPKKVSAKKRKTRAKSTAKSPEATLQPSDGLVFSNTFSADYSSSQLANSAVVAPFALEARTNGPSDPTIALPQLLAAPALTPLGLGPSFGHDTTLLADSTGQIQPSVDFQPLQAAWDAHAAPLPSDTMALQQYHGPSQLAASQLYAQHEYLPMLQLSHTEQQQYPAPQDLYTGQQYYGIPHAPYAEQQLQAPQLAFPHDSYTQHNGNIYYPAYAHYGYTTVPGQQFQATAFDLQEPQPQYSSVPLSSQDWQPQFPTMSFGVDEEGPVASTSSTPLDWSPIAPWN